MYVEITVTACDAMTALPDRPPVRLHVVGDGPHRAALEARAARLALGGRVVFHGFVPRAELARRIAACDAVALPTLADVEGDVEGLGLPALEALGFGRAVIASHTGGLVDLVRDGDTGLLVPPGDAAALARAITRLAATPDLARELGARGRAHAERAFSWSSVLDRWEAAYAAAIYTALALLYFVAAFLPGRHDWHRYLVALAVARGFSVTERDVALRPRRAGASKYTGARRVVVSALDMVRVWLYLRSEAGSRRATSSAARRRPALASQG